MIVKLEHTYTRTITETREEDLFDTLDIMEAYDFVEFGIDGTEFKIRKDINGDFDIEIFYKDGKKWDLDLVEFEEIKKFFNIFEKEGIEKAIEECYSNIFN